MKPPLPPIWAVIFSFAISVFLAWSLMSLPSYSGDRRLVSQSGAEVENCFPVSARDLKKTYRRTGAGSARRAKALARRRARAPMRRRRNDHPDVSQARRDRGESTDAHHRGEIDITGWTWGLSDPAQAQASGVGVGKLAIRDIAIQKPMDLASPLLMAYAAEGRHIASGAITNRRTSGGEFLVVRLSDIAVTSVGETAAHEANQVVETLTLAFGKVELDYRPTVVNGSSVRRRASAGMWGRTSRSRDIGGFRQFLRAGRDPW